MTWHETEIDTIRRVERTIKTQWTSETRSRNTARTAQELEFELGSFWEQRLFSRIENTAIFLLLSLVILLGAEDQVSELIFQSVLSQSHCPKAASVPEH